MSELAHSSRQPSVSLDQQLFLQLRDLLAAYSGVYLDATRQRVLEAGITQRLAMTGDDLARYAERLYGPNGRLELQRLSELVLNHETYFFRNAAHMRALIEHILPALNRRKPADQPLRIWSAGCATGEEAYSLAIAAFEALGNPLPRKIEIWATDLSEAALERGRAATYRGRALSGLPPEFLPRYFQPAGSAQLVAEHVRSLVRFECFNLLDRLPPQAYGVDIIFCQNVTIYFQIETVRALMQRFYEALPDAGLLFLGFSETLWNIFDGFRAQEVPGGYVYYKGVYLEERAPGHQSEMVHRLRPAKVPKPVATDRRATTLAPAAASEQPAETLLARGRALLESGQATAALDLLRRIPPDSPLAARALVLVARIHADRNDLDLAIAEAQRAIALDPLIEAAYLLLGLLYSRQGQSALALHYLERARYLDPNSPLVSFQLAESYLALGRQRDAAREYRNTLRKIALYSGEATIGGVATNWLTESCGHRLAALQSGSHC